MVKLSQPLSDFLNFLRWTAAFLVVAGHIRSLLFVSYGSIENKNMFLQLFYFITSLGHEAVIVFFVLSGFLVGGKLFEEVRNKNFQWKKYLIKRMTRLYVVLVPALLIGGLLDLLGIYYFNDSGIYSHAFKLSSLGYDVTSRLDFQTFICNLLMLQESVSPTFGSNGPLWSLAYEFWYYILFPVLLLLIFKRENKFKFFLYLSVFSMMVVSLHIKIIMYFFIWILGATIFHYHRKILPMGYAIVLLFFLLLVVKQKIVTPYVGDVLIAVALSLLILSAQYKIKMFKFSKFNHLFADFSFSLYLAHYPFILFIIAMLLSTFNVGIKMQPEMESFMLFVGLLLITYLYAFIFYLLFERKTNTVRKFLMERLS